MVPESCSCDAETKRNKGDRELLKRNTWSGTKRVASRRKQTHEMKSKMNRYRRRCDGLPMCEALKIHNAVESRTIQAKLSMNDVMQHASFSCRDEAMRV